jgi:hypothetical protein
MQLERVYCELLRQVDTNYIPSMSVGAACMMRACSSSVARVVKVFSWAKNTLSMTGNAIAKCNLANNLQAFGRI